MTGICHRPFARLALIGLLAMTLGLAACGRKSGLDAPPDASLAQAQAPELQAPGPGMVPPLGGPAATEHPGVGPDGKPMAAPGEKKRIFLDHLIN